MEFSTHRFLAISLNSYLSASGRDSKNSETLQTSFPHPGSKRKYNGDDLELERALVRLFLLPFMQIKHKQ